MKFRALPIAIVAGTLLLTGCGSAAPVAKDGVATADQMGTIDKVARAVAAEKYDDAVKDGYYTYDIMAGLSQDTAKMAKLRKEQDDVWNAVKASFDKGCGLDADHLDSNGFIISNVVCTGESHPTNQIGAIYVSGKLIGITASSAPSS